MTTPKRPLVHDLRYAAEKFDVAVHGMAASAKPLRERLAYAHDSFIAVSEDDLPEDARPAFRSLMARMTWAESRGEGTIAATLAVVSETEARQLVDLVCEIHSRIHDALEERRYRR